MLLKETLRAKILEERKSFDREQKFLENEEIIKSVQDVLKVVSEKADVIGLYWPLNGEPDLRHVANNHKEKVAMPKIKGSKMDFFHYNLNSLMQESEINGLMQPDTNELLQPSIVVLPGLAFSVGGNRIGFGSGYFDRYFNNKNEQKIIKIGVCFHENLYEDLPQEPHDIKLDYLITDKIIIAL